MPFYLLENHEMRVVKIPDNEDHFYRSSLESTIVGMGMSPLNTYGVIKIEKRRGGVVQKVNSQNQKLNK